VAHTFKVGDTIYHERRYWKSEGFLPHEVLGWNAEYLPFKVVRITPKTIYVERSGVKVQLPRGERPQRPGWARHEYLEADGKQYHSRFHEYFYAEIPKVKPPTPKPMSPYANALLLLGIAPPYSDEDVKKSYKRLALKAHPDQGGSHFEFIRLKEARDIALRRY
jgi:hypothetical protein